MKVLLLWSGGVESTSLLKHLLENTNDEVYAHWIKMDNIENRWRNESKAIETLLPLLRSIRPFHFDTSETKICEGKARPMDYSVQYSIGIMAMYYHNCERIYRAGCAEDDFDHGLLYNKLVHRNPNPDEPGFSHRRRAKTLESMLAVGADGNEVAPWLEYYAHPKAWHVKYLGDLFQHTWSCRTPINDKECGHCHTCLERRAAIYGTSNIPEIAAMMRNNSELIQLI